MGLVNAYQKYLDDQDDETGEDDNKHEDMHLLGEVVAAAISELLAGCNANAAVFRESGGSRAILSLVKYEKSRKSALTLFRHLVLAQGGEDDLTSLLELLHTTSAKRMELKNEVMHTVIACLKESHRTRTTFRFGINLS